MLLLQPEVELDLSEPNREGNACVHVQARSLTRRAAQGAELQPIQPLAHERPWGWAWGTGSVGQRRTGCRSEVLNGTAVEYGLDCCDHHSLRCGLLLGRGSGLLWWLGGKTTHAERLQEGGFSLSRAVARITALIKVLG